MDNIKTNKINETMDNIKTNKINETKIMTIITINIEDES
jgi:hypothetical protein